MKNSLRSWIKGITEAQGIIITVNYLIAGRVKLLKQEWIGAGRREAVSCGWRSCSLQLLGPETGFYS